MERLLHCGGVLGFTPDHKRLNLRSATRQSHARPRRDGRCRPNTHAPAAAAAAAATTTGSGAGEQRLGWIVLHAHEDVRSAHFPPRGHPGDVPRVGVGLDSLIQ